MNPTDSQRYFAAKLARETDPFDLHAELASGATRIIVIDPRAADAYALCHIPGALSMPHATISAESAANLPTDAVIVAYGWGPACNAATRAAERLSGLGYTVKEMLGGLEYWRHEGWPVEGTLGDQAPLYG